MQHDRTIMAIQRESPREEEAFENLEGNCIQLSPCHFHDLSMKRDDCTTATLLYLLPELAL